MGKPVLIVGQNYRLTKAYRTQTEFGKALRTIRLAAAEILATVLFKKNHPAHVRASEILSQVEIAETRAKEELLFYRDRIAQDGVLIVVELDGDWAYIEGTEVSLHRPNDTESGWAYIGDLEVELLKTEGAVS